MLLPLITRYYTLLHLITSFMGNKYLLLLYPWQLASYQALRGFLLHVITSYYTLLHLITSFMRNEYLLLLYP